MNKANTTSHNFDEYVSSFCNAFELHKDGDSLLSNCSLNTIGMDNDDYVSDYLDCAYIRSKPPMQKSLSWSSTDPTIACERDSYLMPYACQDYKKATVRYQRPRSITLSPKSSPRYLCVDGRNPFKDLNTSSSTFNNCHQSSSSLSSNSSSNNTAPLSPLSPSANLMSIKEAPLQRFPPSSSKTTRTETVESDESAYSSQDEIDRIHFDLYHDGDEQALQHMQQRKDAEISRLFMQPRRARSFTAPPNISITFEDGYSKNILDVLSEETTPSDADKNNNEVRNMNKNELKYRLLF